MELYPESPGRGRSLGGGENEGVVGRGRAGPEGRVPGQNVKKEARQQLEEDGEL